MKKLLLPIAAIAIVLPTWFGCSKNAQNTVTSSSQQQTSPVALFGKEYNAFNHSKITNTIEVLNHNKFSTLSAPDFTSIIFEDLVMTDNEFQLFLSDLKSNIGGDISKYKFSYNLRRVCKQNCVSFWIVPTGPAGPVGTMSFF